MVQRTTVEIDQELLVRAKRALGCRTTRATIEEALRRASVDAEEAGEQRAGRQRRYLRTLSGRVDPAVLASGEMWR